MAEERSVIYVVTAAKRSDANLVFSAMGRGPNNFGVPLSANGADPASHYYGHDATMDAATANTVSAMPDNGGTLPEIAGTWGEDGLPSEANAQAACAAMQISVATNIEGADHRDAVLEALELQEIQIEI